MQRDGRCVSSGSRAYVTIRTTHEIDTLDAPYLVYVIDVHHAQVTKEFIRLFKMRSEVDQLLFPEMLGKCFIVNTPSLFSYVWAMLSPLVDARTRSKVLRLFPLVLFTGIFTDIDCFTTGRGDVAMPSP